MSNLNGVNRYLLSSLVVLIVIYEEPLQAQPPPDADWQANAVLKDVQVKSFGDIGAGQGVSVRDGKIYIYGDVYSARPGKGLRGDAARIGVIREYDAKLKPTGRVLWLRRKSKPLITHPTGLTWDKRWGTFLGDTVDKKARIYRLNWKQAWKDGNLDRAVLTQITDDVARNGCRPEFVTLGGKRLLATADYGNLKPEIRLYDPALLIKAKRSSAEGVLVHRIRCGPFNQNLHWDEKNKQLTCIQNVVAGRGWRLDVLDLARAVKAGKAIGTGVRVRTITLPPHSELEGYRPLNANRSLFVTAHPKNNVVIGKIHPVKPRLSPKGHDGFTLP